MGLQLANTSLALLAGVLLARALEPAGYGTYAFVFSMASLLAIGAQIGMPQLVIRETAKAQAREEWGLMCGLWRWVTAVSLSLSLFLAAATAGIAWLLAGHGDSPQLATLGWGILLVPLIALGNLRGAALRGLGKVVQGQFPEFVLRPGLLIVFVGAAFWGTQDLTADRAMALHVLAAVTAFVAGACLLHMSRPAPLISHRTIPVFEGSKWITSAVPLAFVSGVYVVNSQTDILMLGVFESARDVGIYRVAVQGGTFVALGLSAINMVVSPQFARLYAEGDMVGLQKAATVSGRVALLLALPVVVVFLLLGKSLLGHLFGPDYVAAYAALTMLSMGQLANAAFGSVALLLNMTGHERITARTAGLGAIANVVLNLVFIPMFGMIGAALATATSTFILKLLLWRSLHRELGLESTAMPTKSIGLNPITS